MDQNKVKKTKTLLQWRRCVRMKIRWSGVTVTDLCPFPKPDPHGDILRFIRNTDRRRQARQKDGFANSMKSADETNTKSEREWEKRARKPEEGTNTRKREGTGSEKGAVGKNSMKGKMSLLDKRRRERQKGKQTYSKHRGFAVETKHWDLQPKMVRRPWTKFSLTETF